MRYKVIKKQPNAKMCFVCGLNNSCSLHADFYELENGELFATFTAQEGHQSYPGIAHGGVLTAILDEIIGRAIMMKYDDPVWGATVELNMKFKKPVSTNTKLRAIARITEENDKIFKGTGEILLPDGQIAVKGFGTFMKVSFEKIAKLNEEALDWQVVTSPEDLVEVEL
ncbi:MAG: PaaI family thioesterase [Bacteroidetes bacterium]|nr:PaaI family thioesterase [Bacteroidota bacterium]